MTPQTNEKHTLCTAALVFALLTGVVLLLAALSAAAEQQNRERYIDVPLPF